MIARQELMRVLDRHAGSCLTNSALQELADAILKLDAPKTELIDSGTIFPAVEVRYSGGVHYPKGGESHRITECNRNQCGPKL